MINICANRIEEGRIVCSGMIYLHCFSEMAYAAIYCDSQLTLCVRLENVVVVSLELMQLRLQTDGMISYEISGICEFEFAQFFEAISICKSICSLAFHLNTTVRDIFLDGAYAKCDKDISCFRDLGSYLTNCASSLVGAMESKQHVPHVPLAEGTENVKLIFSETVCVYCEKKDVGMDAFSMKVHPYVPVDYSLRVLYFCQRCYSNYMNYRKQAVELGLLVLPGEYNEEVCACCADSPAKLVLCSKCPRSFCDPCLQRQLTPKAYSEMKSEEHWLCMCCAPSEVQFRTIASRLSLSLPLLGSLSGVAASRYDVHWTAGSVVQDNVTAEGDELQDIFSASCDDSEGVRLLLTENSNGEDTWTGGVMEPDDGNVINDFSAPVERGKKITSSARRYSLCGKKIYAQGVNARSRRNNHGCSKTHNSSRFLSKKTGRDGESRGGRARHVDGGDLQEPPRKVGRSRSKDSPSIRSINGGSRTSNRHNGHGHTVVTKEDGILMNDGRRHSTRARSTTMKLFDFDEDTDSYIASLSRPGSHSCTYKGGELSSSASATIAVPVADNKQPRKKEKTEKPRKVTSDGPTKQVGKFALPVKPMDTALLPPVNTAQDEVYYFSQYVDYLLPLQGIPLEAQDTEDFCFLCKDGGDLVECDNMRHKGPHRHCKKVYHEYCLPYSVDEDSVWSCFRHFCGICGKESCSHQCKLCPNSFCESCIAVWSQYLGHRSYILSQGTFTPMSISDFTECAPTKKSPGRKRKAVVDIICGSCMRMIERCRDRGMWNESIDLGPVVSIVKTVNPVVAVDGPTMGDLPTKNVDCAEDVLELPITNTAMDLQLSRGVTPAEVLVSSSELYIQSTPSKSQPIDDIV